jgi:type I restriction enzyme S subunit
MSWEIRNIESLTTVVTKGTTPSTYGYEFIDNGVNYIRAEGISKDGYVDESTFLKVSEECNQKLFRSQLREDDILFSIAGMALGKTGIVKEDYLPANTNQAVAIIRPIQEIVSPKFLQYYFINPQFYKMVNSVSAQSAQPNINLAQIKSLEISLPPLTTQKRIASILSAYDDLIENNGKRIKLLEETAQNIYKEWFVHFRFPNYESMALDAVSGLPVGWENTEIKNFSNVVTGKTPSTSNLNYFGGDIPFIKTPDMHQNIYMENVEQYLSIDGAQSQSNKYLPKNTVIISCIGARAGVVAMTSKISQTNQQINAVLPKIKNINFWLYFSCKGLENTIHAIGSSGATMTNVSKGKFENIKLNLPNENILTDFENNMSYVFEQILILQQQNQKLKEARDILLPRLMNRTIEV